MEYLEESLKKLRQNFNEIAKQIGIHSFLEIQFDRKCKI